MPSPDKPTPLHYRTLWISDLHLGTKGCQADELLDFLKHTDSDTLYLVGDIIDGWRLSRSWYWPQAHNDVVQKILRKARKGTQVIYIPGNHDEFARHYLDHTFGDIQVALDVTHQMADGRRLWILHGDAYDGVVKYAKWLAYLGDHAYTLALKLNHGLNSLRRRLGLPYWSLSAYLKHRVKNAVQFMDDFENTIAEEARKRGVDGVVCGHIHHAELRTVRGLLYANDGDWVESCTALAEDHSGKLHILRWRDMMEPQPTQSVISQTLDRETPCTSSLLPMPGTLRSMGWFARWRRFGGN